MRTHFLPIHFFLRLLVKRECFPCIIYVRVTFCEIFTLFHLLNNFAYISFHTHRIASFVSFVYFILFCIFLYMYIFRVRCPLFCDPAFIQRPDKLGSNKIYKFEWAKRKSHLVCFLFLYVGKIASKLAILIHINL